MALLFIVILLFPIKLKYKDGGTTTYNAILYKIIVWNILDRNEPSGFKRGVEIHLFPNNFYSLDYYEDITFPDRDNEFIPEEDDSSANNDNEQRENEIIYEVT